MVVEKKKKNFQSEKFFTRITFPAFNWKSFSEISEVENGGRGGEGRENDKSNFEKKKVRDYLFHKFFKMTKRNEEQKYN